MLPSSTIPVSQRGGHVFLIMLAITPIVELFASLSLYVTYINLFYLIFLVIVAWLLTPLTADYNRALLGWLVLPAMYVIGFFFISVYGVSFEYSLLYKVFLLPVHLCFFYTWYMAAYFFDAKSYMKYVSWATLVFLVGSVAFAGSGILDVEQTRVMYGVDLPVGVVAAVVFSNSIVLSLLLFGAALSVKKTVVLCSIVGFAITYVLNRIYVRYENVTSREAHAFMFLLGLAAIIATLSIEPVYEVIATFGGTTIDRIFSERDDMARTLMSQEFFDLLEQYFPFGTGYYTFGHLTKHTLPYITYTVDGTELDEGMSLHNTFMHYALEGGVIILIIIAVLYWRLVGVLRRLLSNRESQSVAIVIVGWVVVGLIYGLFNQYHGTRYMFGVFGFAFGYYERCRRDHAQSPLLTVA